MLQPQGFTQPLPEREKLFLGSRVWRARSWWPQLWDPQHLNPIIGPPWSVITGIAFTVMSAWKCRTQTPNSILTQLRQKGRAHSWKGTTSRVGPKSVLTIWHGTWIWTHAKHISFTAHYSFSDKYRLPTTHTLSVPISYTNILNRVKIHISLNELHSILIYR
jgi:hypothetical protein